MAKSKATNTAQQRGEHLAVRYFRLGHALNQLQSVSAGEFERLAAEHGLPAVDGTRYKSMRLAKRFELKELQALCREREGRTIGWSHVIELLQVSGAKERERLASRVVRESLDADALRQIIRTGAGRPNLRPGSGRRRKNPGTADEAIRRARSDLESLTFNLGCLTTFPDVQKKRLLKAITGLSELGSLLSSLTVKG